MVEVEQDFDTVAQDTGFFGNMLAGAKAQMMGLVQATKAFIATPIGAIIGALTVVLGPLISFLTKTQEGVEKVRVVTAQASAVFDVIIDRISQVGKALFGFGRAIVQFFSGDWEGASESAKQATDLLTTSFDNLGKEIAEEVELAGELEKSLIALEKAENTYSLTREKRNTQIARLRLIAKDENVPIQERIEALREAIRLEALNTEEALKLQRERVRIAQEDYDRAESVEADRKALIDEQIKLEQLRQGELNTTRRLITELASLNKRAEKELTNVKRIEIGEREKEEDKELKNTIKRVERKSQLTQQEIEMEKKKSAITIDEAQRTGALLASVLGKQTKLGIALAVAQAIADTYKGANKALAQVELYPLNFVNAGLIIAQGLANVQQILRAGQEAGVAVSAGSGGGFATSGNSAINFTPDVVRSRNQSESVESVSKVEATVSVQEINRVSNRVKVKEGSSRV